jgi:hypothetical protein
VHPDLPVSETKPDNKLVNYLTKILFPRLQPWERKKHLNTILLVVLISVLCAATLGGLLYWMNRSHM